jgi:hypothetical protein
MKFRSRSLAVRVRTKNLLVGPLAPLGGRPTRDFLALLARFRQANSNGLPAAFHLAAFATPAAFGCATIIAPHLVFDVTARARRISSLASFGHFVPPIFDRAITSARRLITPVRARGCKSFKRSEEERPQFERLCFLPRFGVRLSGSFACGSGGRRAGGFGVTERDDVRACAGAFAQCSTKVDRVTVLLQKICECFVGELLKRHHPLVRHQPELRPAFVIDLNALTGHVPAYQKLTRPAAF